MAKKYSHDMSKESEKDGVFEEGWYNWEVFKVEETQSKAGNDMFIVTLAENITLNTITAYMIATPGKRWFLKGFLKACGVEASKDGVYDWDIEDVTGQIIQGRIRNEKQEDWIDRNNQPHEGEDKSRLVEFKAKETDIGPEPEKA